MDYKKIAIFWKEYELPVVKKRLIDLDLSPDFIFTITGPRRAGKTYLCFQKIQELIFSGISKENIFYINFEDSKLINLDADGLDLVLENLMDLSDVNNKQNIYLFLDEIQNVKNWSSWVRTRYDTKKKIKLILTGSSSKMLSRDISTNLRGRVLNKEVLPLSFEEYLSWSDKKINMRFAFAGGKESKVIKKLFLKYLVFGGYPAIFFNPVLKDDVLQGYLNLMIFKDVVERYNIRDSKALEVLLKFVFESSSKDLSYSKLANKLKSIGYSMSKETIINYISYFEDAYLFFQVLKYEYSINKQLGSIKKVYTIDNGLLNSVSFKFSKDYGKLLENLVFLELYRQKKKIYYSRDNGECDFLIQEKNKIVDCVQVCYELSDDNRDREIQGLVEAMDKFGLSEGLILTYDQDEEFLVGKKKVRVMAVWKWMLDVGNR